MAQHRTSPTVALIQIRERPDVEQHERRCVLERIDIPEENLRCVNVIRQGPSEWSVALEADAVIIGGAGVHTVTKEYPFTPPLADLVRKLVEWDRPLFGCCWGHQFIALALGGRVERDESRGETGTHAVELTDEGAQEALLEGVPRSFDALMGHNDHVVALPEGGVELARTERSGNQMFRVSGRATYGAQFHPEMTRQRLIERLEVYRDQYVRAGEDFDEMCAALRPSTHTKGLLQRFMDLHVR